MVLDYLLQKVIFYMLLICFRVVGGLELIPALIRKEDVYTLDRTPVHHRAQLKCLEQAVVNATSKMSCLKLQFPDGEEEDATHSM